MAETKEMQAPPKKWWKGKLAWMKNKYLLTVTIFLVWMLFFDLKDVGSSLSRWRKFRELQESEKQLSQKIKDTKAERAELKDNVQTIEKYAREKFLMKKDNEDLFIVNETPAQK